MSITRTIAVAGTLLLAGACAKHPGGAPLATEADSLAYVIGMNVGMNLQRMDSAIRVEAVCAGVRDALLGQTLLTTEEARTYYLGYMTYEKPERARAYEEQFLEDIRRSNRAYARTKSGLTYAVDAIGDEEFTPTAIRDTVSLRYVMRTADGRELYSSYARNDTLRVSLGSLPDGVQESLRLIGRGGRIEAWMPSSIAYGAAGNAELGVEPNATLFFEMELVDVEKYAARRPGRR